MSNVNYKYNIGDTVRFKERFEPIASSGLTEMAGLTVKVLDCRFYGGPCYKFEGYEDKGWFTEQTLAGYAN